MDLMDSMKLDFFSKSLFSYMVYSVGLNVLLISFPILEVFRVVLNSELELPEERQFLQLILV